MYESIAHSSEPTVGLLALICTLKTKNKQKKSQKDTFVRVQKQVSVDLLGCYSHCQTHGELQTD